MKQLTVFYALVCITFTSCMQNDDINISYVESDKYYSMNAQFSKSKTRAVERYLDRKIGARSNISFANVQNDARLTLDDRTKFYMRKAPGHIQIKLDKDENSFTAYRRIKSMCEGMEKVLK